MRGGAVVMSFPRGLPNFTLGNVGCVVGVFFLSCPAVENMLSLKNDDGSRFYSCDRFPASA